MIEVLLDSRRLSGRSIALAAASWSVLKASCAASSRVRGRQRLGTNAQSRDRFLCSTPSPRLDRLGSEVMAETTVLVADEDRVVDLSGVVGQARAAVVVDLEVDEHDVFDHSGDDVPHVREAAQHLGQIALQADQACVAGVRLEADRHEGDGREQPVSKPAEPAGFVAARRDEVTLVFCQNQQHIAPYGVTPGT